MFGVPFLSGARTRGFILAMLAYVDESYKREGLEGTYLLGATLLAEEQRERVSSIMLGYKPPRANKLHYVDLGRVAQAKVLQGIGLLPVSTIVVIADRTHYKKQERARRKCLEILLPILEEGGVDVALLERRNVAQDGKDVQLAKAMRVKRAINHLMIEHVAGEDEPLLWIPDQVLGALRDVWSTNALPDDWLAAWDHVDKGVHIESI